MKIKSIRKPEVLISKLHGNRDLPESEQISFNVKVLPTNSEASSYKGFRMAGSGSIELVNGNDAAMLTRHIGGIKNMVLEDFYEPVTNGSSLAKSKCLELAEYITEIREFLTETAEVLDEKEK